MFVVNWRLRTGHRCVVTTLALVSAFAMISSDLGAQKPPTPSVEALLDAASDYARAAYPKLANLVATEEYVQERRIDRSPPAKG